MTEPVATDDSSLPDLAGVLRLDGKVAVVTGGTKGLGRTIAESLLVAGAEVVVCARNPPESPVEAQGRQARFVAADVRSQESVEQLIATTLEQHGKLDILVNNAGGAPPADSATASARFTDKIVGLNLTGPLLCAQAAYAAMAPDGQRSGDSAVIVNISSVSGSRANPLGVAYGAAKAGLDNLTRTLAHEWGPAIRVVSLTVGLVITPDARAFYGDDETVDRIAAVLAMKRFAVPQDIANVVLFAVSPLASYVTGTAIEVHGGGEGPSYLLASTGSVTGVSPT